jgi:Ca2+-binding RTX toxin-like protein
VAGLFSLGMAVAPGAHASVSCSYAPAPAYVLTVAVDGNSSSAEVSRHGDQILVTEFRYDSDFVSDEGHPRACSGGVPTVHNTDTVNVLVRGDPDLGADLVLEGGPFAPGVKPEPEGAPEIEIQFSGRYVLALATGTARADEFRWGPGGSNAGLNLNPGSPGDRDVDLTVKSKSSAVGADGAAGNDTIIPAPGTPAVGDVFADGGSGADRLVAPRNAASVMNGGPGRDALIGGRLHDLLSGNGGNDRVAGNAGRDDIDGGRGNDLLLGGRGRDVIASRDGRRDTVRCGPGRDRVRADRRDRLRGCERASRR